MAKHVPSSHELESAVIGVLGGSKTEMTAKSVRTTLLTQHPGWKMPAERRIAKFVKRQNSKAEKKLQDGGTKSVFGKFFKSDRTSNHSTNTTNTNIHIKNIGNASTSSTSSGNHNKQHQQQQQQVSQRKSLRQASVSMLKGLSKSKKSNQGIPVTTSSTANLFKKSKITTDAAGPISYQQAEAERSASIHPVEDGDNSYPQAKAVIENVQDMEHIKAADEKQLSLKEAPATKETDSSHVPDGKDVVADSYVDDNDGQLNLCQCEACVIL